MSGPTTQTRASSSGNALKTVAKYLAIDRQIEKNKQEYYYVLNRCSNGIYQQDPHKYHIELFLKYMIKVMRAALADIEVYKQKCDAINSLSESAQRILACFKDQPETRLTTGQLVALTGLPRRTITYILKTLVGHKFIQRYGQGRSVRYQLVF